MTRYLYPGSVLKELTDGTGAYYGTHDGTLINVRLDSTPFLRWMRWFAHIGDTKIGGDQGFGTVQEAEAAAIAWVKANPA